MAKVENIWMLTREYAGLAGAGGLKDVAKELSEALVRAGKKVTVMMPHYGFMDYKALGFKPLKVSFEVDMNYAHEERREKVELLSQELNGVRLILIEADRYREKLGVYTYTEQEEAQEGWKKKGAGHFDYFAMNILLQKTAAEALITFDEKPDIVHCHDGHTACFPALIRELEGFRQYFRHTGTVITVHNAGIGYHQDVADLPFAKAITALPWRIINESLLNGSFDPFLAGARYGIINTVSEEYARELQETDLDALTGWLGHALKDRGIKLEGITNGINPEDYDPRHPERLGLPAAFDPLKGDLEGKKICRKTLLEDLSSGQCGRAQCYGRIKDRPDVPLLTAISRLTEQKGIDILAAALKELLAEDKDFLVIILGTGTREIEDQLISLAQNPEYQERMAVLIGYDPGLANRIYAAGDFFIIPSKYEPCGLTDYMATLMGNLPIVRHTGGLIKVLDGKTGFAYKEQSARALAETIRRALEIFRQQPEKIKKMQQQAIKHILENYTWDRVVHRYLDLYQRAQKMAPEAKEA
ncbi:glycogen synthase [Thermosulfuriphilus sp.]